MKSLCTILSFLFSLGALWGQHTVTGTVTSATGEPLIGVNILIKGTGNGTATDIDGTYSIAVPDEKAVLVFTYTGFKGKELVPGALTTLDVVLDEDVELIDEVVVIGYGTQKKSDLTGAISTIKSDEVKRVPSANVEQILQGKVAGVQVTPVSGRPGEGAVVRIRGVGTLNDASPLYVVDGMLLDDISFLNPNDIASIEVLKDASATAIYGSRGANGVVIVSTNQGANHQARFNFSSYYASQQVVRQIDMVNGTEFATLANEVATNEGRKPLFADPEKYGVGTNWQDVIFQTAPIQNYQISANGGNDNVLYNISVNHFDQEGIVRGSRYQRTTVRINNEYSLRKNIKVGHNISLIASKNDYEANVIGMAYQAEPIIPVFDSLGNFADATVRIPVGNPEVSIFYNYNKGNGLRTVGNTYLEAKLLKYFTFKSNFGLDIQQGRSKRYTPVFEVTPTSLQRNEQSSLSVNSDRSNSWLWENTMSFYREWTNHRLNVLGGVTAQEYVFESLGGSRINFPGDTPEFYYLNAGETDGQTNYNTSYEWAMLSYLGRINYTFKDRYLLTASFRADGSSRFGKNNRYGYFPSFAVGWNITNEPFMSSIPLFSRLKLRASWGQIGNDKIGAYAGRPTVTSNLIAVFGRNEAIQNGASIVSLANPDIRWEETTQSNAGFEFGLLDNRLQGNLDYYVRTTNDILVNVPIPEYIGADASPVINAAKVRNQGLDFNVSWRESKGKFDYEIGILGSTVNNEVLALGEGQEEIFGGGLGVGGLLGTRTVVGLPIGAFYGYKVDGLYQSQSDLESYPVQGSEVPGDLRFVDTNNDGVITTADRTYIGSPIPSLIYGFTLSAGYAGFDLAVDFNGQYGNKIINAKKMARFGTYNFEASYLNRWTGEGTSDSEPRVTNGGHNYEFSERFVEDGSFMRLRTIQFGYTLPAQVTSRIKFSSIRFYASGTNLVTWTKYSGYTPEITNASSIIAVGIDQGVYPIAKVITFGLDANF
ncbi:MAG: TonB-dependent receptor [Saprospiraceae bacterium]|nr:TonB-dependent receptor [Saprospiraceae bacterium]